MDRKPSSAPLYTGDDTASIHDEEKRTCASHCTGCLVATLCIAMLFVVLAVIGLCIWLFLFLPMDGKTDDVVVFNVNVTLDDQYLRDYRYPDSAEFRNLERSYVTAFDEIFGNNEKYEDFYEETTISHIRPGSVAIISWVSFERSISDSIDIPDELRQEIIETLSIETGDGRLGSLHADVLNFDVGNPIDLADRPQQATPDPRRPPTSPTTREPHPPTTGELRPPPTRDPRPPATDEPSPVPPRTIPPQPEYCELNEYKCVYMTLLCIKYSLVCNGEPNCPYGDDEDFCPDDCGDDYIFLDPGDSYELTSANYPNRYTDNSFCQWVFEAQPGRQLLLQFNDFDLEKDYDFLYISLDGQPEYTEASVNFTGTELPPVQLSQGSIVVVTMVTEDSSRGFGFVLEISDIEPSDLFDTGICGTRPAVDPRRIFGGEDAAVGEMPWAGQLSNDGIDAFCGVTLLDKFWAVTAAHCVVDETDTLYVVFGDYANRNRGPSTPERQTIEVALVFAHPSYTTAGFEDFEGYTTGDVALIRLAQPVKYSDYVRPACITASTDEPSDYQHCRVSGWGLTEVGSGSSISRASFLQIATVPILPLEVCAEVWKQTYSYGPGFSSDAWFDEGDILCGGIGESSDSSYEGDVCSGDSGSGWNCLGNDGRWHLVGIVSFSTPSCAGRPAVYARVSTYRHFIWETRHNAESCLSSGKPDDCLQTLGCTAGRLCPFPICSVDEFRCAIGDCIPIERTCNGYADCYDFSDEALPLCYDDCGNDDIYLSYEDTFTLTSLNYPDAYPVDTSCQWTVTSPAGSRIFVEFDFFDLEDGFDYVFIAYSSPIGDAPNGEYANYFYTGSELPHSFVSPSNQLYVAMTSDISITTDGFSLNMKVIVESEELPALCDDNFQVFAGESGVCDGTMDCLDNSDEAPCECAEVEILNIDPDSYLFLTSPFYPSYYTNSLSCTWIPTIRQNRYILVSILELDLDSETDALQISSRNGIGGVFTYNSKEKRFTSLFFQTNAISVNFESDSFWSAGGFNLIIYETTGDDCLVSTNPYCVQRPGCNQDCYVEFCSNGIEVYPESWSCDGYEDCLEGSDEQPFCECGERDVQLASGEVFELLSPVSVLDPSTYRQSSSCQWVISTSHGNVLFAHFNTFNIEDGKEYAAYNDVVYGDYLYIGTGTSAQSYGRVNYTGSGIPLDLETPGNRLVLTFVTDDSIGYEGFAVTIVSRHPQAELKCANGLEILRGDLRCNGVVDCYGPPSDEEGCGECGQEQYNLVPGGDSVNLVSPNYPFEYEDNTFCAYTITTYQGYRILAQFLNLDLQDGFDFIYIDAGDSDTAILPYTGTVTPDHRALDIISTGNAITIYFETDESVTQTGYKIQLTSKQSDFTDDILLCGNGVQIFSEEYICDNIYDCDDNVDEAGCVDIFDTEICGTRPAVDPRKVFNADDVRAGEMPWAGQLTLDGINSFCGATLLDEFWAITAAHCIADIIDPIYLVFGDPATRDRATSTTHRQIVELGLFFVHPSYIINGFEDYEGYTSGDLALIRFTQPVKYSDYVRPACITTSNDEPNEYEHCRAAGWGLTDGPSPSSSDVLPSWLQIATVPLLTLEQCSQVWSDFSSGFSSDVWLDDGGLLCGGVVGTEDITNSCYGDSGSGLMCLGDDDRWHLVGIVSFGSLDCRTRPSVYARISKYRTDIWHTRYNTESCLSSGNTNCLETIGCTGGSLCPLPECGFNQFRCRTGFCIPAENLCDGYTDCYDHSDERAPYCYDDCGNEDIYLSHDETYTLTSLNYPDPYPNTVTCQWIVTSPPGTRIFAEFEDFHLENYYDFLYIGYEPAEIPIGYPVGEYPVYAYTGDETPPSFLSPIRVLYVTMTSDESINADGFSIHFSIYTDNEELPALCDDNFQVFAGESDVCDGTDDCKDNSDEASCVCPAIENLHIPPDSYISMTSPNYPDIYYNSLSCRWIVTARQDKHILVSITDISLDIENDALQISSGTGIEGVFTYRKEEYQKYPSLYFQTSAVVVHFQSDSYWNRERGIFLAIYETSGDDCVASTDQNCPQRTGCSEECYIHFCANGVEAYPASWLCDGYVDCSDKSDEAEFCECGERDIQLPFGNTYELSSPVSILNPSTYRDSSNCQWVITTSPGHVLFAHFNGFDIEDGNEYETIDGVLYGDYLYAGSGTSAQSYRVVTYTGSKAPLDLETPGNRLVLTFVTDDSISYDGFAVTIRSRQPASHLKCENNLEIYRIDQRCDGVVDCYGLPSDEAGCGGPF